MKLSFLKHNFYEMLLIYLNSSTFGLFLIFSVFYHSYIIRTQHRKQANCYEAVTKIRTVFVNMLSLVVKLVVSEKIKPFATMC